MKLVIPLILMSLLLSGCAIFGHDDSKWISAPSDIRDTAYGVSDEVKQCMKSHNLNIRDGHPSDTSIDYVAGEKYHGSDFGWSWLYTPSSGGEPLRVCGLAWGDERIQLATDPNKSPNTWNANIHRHEWAHIWQVYGKLPGPMHPQEPGYTQCAPHWRVIRDFSTRSLDSKDKVVITRITDDGQLEDIIMDRWQFQNDYE